MEMFAFSFRCKDSTWECEQRVKTPFDELILSWNGFRPAFGFWTFFVGLYQNAWSPWLKYAQWGASEQKTFHSQPLGSFAKTYQDVAVAKSGNCSAFRVRVKADQGADLTTLRSLSVCCSKELEIEPTTIKFPFATLIDVPQQSQMLLNHPRYRELCSPTSTATAIHYLSKHKRIDPVAFAGSVRDTQFDIYGNWILNTAAAYEALEGKYRTFVARLDSFSQCLNQIERGFPVIVSVKGPLAGSALPYAEGHLILLTGYDPTTNQVHCMDPAFSTNEETAATYPLESFLEAWKRRKNLAYLFEPTCSQ